MSRSHLVLSLAVAASAAGCDALLGVEDVTLDRGSGGGGAGARGSAGGDARDDGAGEWTASPGPFAAGAGGEGTHGSSTVAASTSAGGGGAPGAGGGPSSTAASTTSGGGDPAGPASASSASSSSSSSSSTAGGGACVQDRPACPGVTPSGFQEGSALDAWLVESPKVKVAGKTLRLDPDEDGVAASVRSVAPVAPSASCAVWVRREDGEDGVTRLALLGADGGERLAIAWGASGASAHVDGVEVGRVGASDAAARLLRIRLEADAAHLEIRSDDATCWEPVAGPVAVAAPEGPVRLSYAGDGKAKLDDYAVW